MFSLFSGRSKRHTIPQQLYGVLVAQAREPRLFSGFGVPDTVMGRFDMLALHVYLFARRLRTEDSEISIALSQDVFDLFVADVDRALRELGVGDTTVPKRKKAMIRSFYGQIDDFDTALANEDWALLEARLADRYLKGRPDPDEKGLADHVIRTARQLASIPFEDFRLGKLAMNLENSGLQEDYIHAGTG